MLSTSKFGLHLLVILTCMVWSAASIAQTLPNGCGSGWSTYLVPNSLPIVRCQFKQACDEHDLCYGKCETSTADKCEYRRCRPGGDLYKSDECITNPRLINAMAEATSRRQTCDSSLSERIRALNTAKAVCAAFAIVYRDAVKAFGDGAWAGADLFQFQGPPPDQAAYEEAIREFFKNGKEEQFARLVQGADAGRPVVNLKKAIKFSPTAGLVNVP